MTLLLRYYPTAKDLFLVPFCSSRSVTLRPDYGRLPLSLPSSEPHLVGTRLHVKVLTRPGWSPLKNLVSVGILSERKTVYLGTITGTTRVDDRPLSGTLHT